MSQAPHQEVAPLLLKDVAEHLEYARHILEQQHDQVLAVLEGRTQIRHLVLKPKTFRSVQLPAEDCPSAPLSGSDSSPCQADELSRAVKAPRMKNHEMPNSLPDDDDDDHDGRTYSEVTSFDAQSIDVMSNVMSNSSKQGDRPPKASENSGMRQWEVRDAWKNEKMGSLLSQKTRADLGNRSFTFDDVLHGHRSEGERCCDFVIWHPNDYKRPIWDSLTMVLILYEVVMIPFGLFEPKTSPLLVGLDWTSRIFWSLDIWVTFTSGFCTNDGAIEMSPAKIARRYIKTWFAIDSLVIIIDWLEAFVATMLSGLGLARMAKASRIFRFLRMLRLIRLAKANVILTLLAEKLFSEEFLIIVDVLKLGVVMVSTGHFVACVWYAIAKDSPLDQNWLDVYGFAEEGLRFRYVISMRWALSQFSGGMDEVTPQNFWEHLYSCIVWLVAWWLGTAILSILTSHMTQLYTLGNKQSQHLNAINRYLRQQEISKALCMRVVRNAQYTLKMRKKQAHESAVGIADLISVPLLTEVHFEMYYPFLDPHPFFKMCIEDSPHVVRKICHGAMKTTYDTQGDRIFHIGEAADAMIIITIGQVLYLSGTHGHDPDESILDVGSWLSEASLWTKWAHQGTLTAKTDCRCFNLIAVDFEKIVIQNEPQNFDPRKYARDFVNRLNEMYNDLEDVTDLAFEVWPENQGSHDKPFIARLGSHLGPISKITFNTAIAVLPIHGHRSSRRVRSSGVTRWSPPQGNGKRGSQKINGRSSLASVGDLREDVIHENSASSECSS